MEAARVAGGLVDVSLRGSDVWAETSMERRSWLGKDLRVGHRREQASCAGGRAKRPLCVQQHRQWGEVERTDLQASVSQATAGDLFSLCKRRSSESFQWSKWHGLSHWVTTACCWLAPWRLAYKPEKWTLQYSGEGQWKIWQWWRQ